MKIVKSLEKLQLFIKRISKTIKIEAKEQKGEFLPNVIRNIRSIRKKRTSRKGVIREGEGTIRASENI